MIYTIDETICVGCGMCFSLCPVVAVKVDEKTGKFVIDKNLCTGCSACAGNCPVAAIY